MPQTLEQLVQLRTKEEILAELLTALQGVGFVLKTGSGAGSLAADGVAALTASVRIKIVTTGELGSGAFQVSTDGGTTYGSTVTIPGGGSYVVPNTGATITFGTAPEGAGDSFVAGDVYAFELTTPTFPVTSWQPFSTGRTLAELDAEALENYCATQQGIAKGGFLSTAKGSWMDLWLEDMYGLKRLGGQTTVGTVILTDSGNAGPFTIAIGDVWVGTPGGLRFNNTTGGTLPQGGTLALTFRAESPGSIYNVAGGAISVLFTALAGVTVANPNPLGGSWISSAGADTETDPQGELRAKARWASLGVGLPGDTYTLWAKTAAAGAVTRVLSRASPSIPGNIEVFLAGNGGAVSGGVVAAVQAYLNDRATFTSVPVVASAAAHGVTVAGTLYVKAGNKTAAAAAASQNATALFYSGTTTDNEDMPGVEIGGTVYVSAIIEELMRAPGARNLALTLPAADVALAATEVAVLTMNIVTDGTGNPATDLCIVEV